jgi:hypothetical protein
VLRVKEIEVVDPSTNASGSEQTPRPSGDGNGMKPSTPTGSKADVTHSFKTKTECISLCVLRSSFTHKATNSKINNIISVY